MHVLINYTEVEVCTAFLSGVFGHISCLSVMHSDIFINVLELEVK